uniref:F-box only protein 46-like n=1 Tax=Callorhinchus milii TaxID=7868 RepID=A0A4W3GD42_CALMI
MLDTWYVIKPGNTREKIAFFVAHQCGVTGTGTGTGTGSRHNLNSMKVKGNWETDGTKPKRRRKSHDPGKRPPGHPGGRETGQTETLRLCPAGPGDSPAGGGPVCHTDLVSVAEMVALVEQRASAALRGYAKPCRHPDTDTNPDPPTTSPVVSRVDEEDDDEEEGGVESRGAPDTNRVAEAIAKIESGLREPPGGGGGGGRGEEEEEEEEEKALPRRNGLSKGEGSVPGGKAGAEVRIAFRVASSDNRATGEPPVAHANHAGANAGCIFVSCNRQAVPGLRRSVEKITCDLYQLIGPSPDGAFPPEIGPDRAGGVSGSAAVASAAKPATETPADRLNGFHLEVVVTGGVEPCVFFGEGSEEESPGTGVVGPPGGPGGGGAPATVRVTVSPDPQRRSLEEEEEAEEVEE